jgi:aminoglycoside N3'-acetyltransferase
MVLDAKNDWNSVNAQPERDRDALLTNAEPFGPNRTPADPDVGYLAEALRQKTGTLVSDNSEGRFAARAAVAAQLLAGAPWNDYFGPGSPLDRLCRIGGSVLRLGGDPDTTTLLHWSEYRTNLPQASRVRRHRRVLGHHGGKVRTVECLNDDGEGIVDWPGDDYFKTISDEYLSAGRGVRGRVGSANAELLDAGEFAEFGAQWMVGHFL